MIQGDESIRIGKKSYRINPNFDIWIKFLYQSEKLSAEEIELGDFLDFIYTDLFVEKPPMLKMLISAIQSEDLLIRNPKLAKAALKNIMTPIFRFAQHTDSTDKKEKSAEHKSRADVFDFEKDWKYIDLSFLSCGIDLYRYELHWWRFKWLLQAMILDSFKEIVRFRSIPSASLSKLSKSEREYYKSKKKAYALTHAVNKTADEHWADMRKYIANRYNEHEKKE